MEKKYKITKPSLREKINQFESFHVTRINRPDIKVACILDHFSYECFKYECSLEQLSLPTWKKQLKKFKPHFLFVESAWNGKDDTWKKELTKIKKNPNAEIRKLVRYCNKNGIKTVFWNKEDPPSYQLFIETAKLFDFIFTTDVNCLSKYRKDVGHNRVNVLPFAAQPVIHNPIHSSHNAKENVAFAGKWYEKKHFQRKDDMKVLFTPALEFGLDIFDRMYVHQKTKFKYPDQYKPYIVGVLDYEDMPKAYKLYNVFLNVNSVKESPTMFSRRVFEILASGVNLISSYSLGIKKTFKKIVPLSRTIEETKKHLDKLLNNREYSERLRVLGIREVYKKHLYKHRFNQILKQVNIEREEKKAGVSIITFTNNPLYLNNIFENYNRQKWDMKELIIFFYTENENIKNWIKRSEKLNDITIYTLAGKTALNQYLKRAVKKSKYDFIAKFNDSDYYGPHYLTDLMLAFKYTDASVVGKHTIYSYLQESKDLSICFPEKENRFSPVVCEGAFIFKKEILNRVRFSSTNHTGHLQFIRNCLTAGYKIYVTNRYNYVQIKEKYSLLNREDRRYKINCRTVTNTDDYKVHVTV